MRHPLGPPARASRRWLTARLLGGLVSALFVAEVACATLYDAVADFNTTGVQTSGATWSYGTETAVNGVFRFLPNFVSVSCGPDPTPQSACQPAGATVLSYFKGSPLVGYIGGGALGKNMSGSTIIYPRGALADNTVVFPANVLGMGPGDTLQVTRWTAPAAGEFQVTGFFQDLQAASVGLYVVVNGGQAFASSFSGTATLQGQIPFAVYNLRLLAGNTIDFVVDGRQGGSDDDLVGLSARVAVGIPEPTSWILFTSGLLILVAFGRCSRDSWCGARHVRSVNGSRRGGDTMR